jgi:UDP-glucose 4-epimerase
MSNVLVTGATGFIGGSVSLALKDAGYKIIGIDKKYGKHLNNTFEHLIVGDYADVLKSDFSNHNFSHIVHCAGTSLVGPSIKDPGDYYDNNVAKTIKLLNWIKDYSPSTHLIFSSSASVYKTKPDAIDEDDPLEPISPYAKSKKIIEDLIHDYNKAYGLKYTIFRYFNACGAMDSFHGQRPQATHIFPKLFDAAWNNKPFDLNGNDYDTIDGTCVRDYIHVKDLAKAHLKAISKGFVGTVNLGSGCGYSNLDIIKLVEKKLKTTININHCERREGDTDRLIADVIYAKMILQWKAEHDLPSIVDSLVQWYNSNNYKEQL